MEIDDVLMEKTFALNVNGTLYGMQPVLPHMLANKHNVIVNMATWPTGAAAPAPRSTTPQRRSGSDDDHRRGP
jgi:NADP-dependent 3-hydroxy acid dehydrogenase YdfG